MRSSNERRRPRRNVNQVKNISILKDVVIIIDEAMCADSRLALDKIKNDTSLVIITDASVDKDELR